MFILRRNSEKGHPKTISAKLFKKKKKKTSVGFREDIFFKFLSVAMPISFSWNPIVCGNFKENLVRNISAKFGSDQPSGLGREDVCRFLTVKRRTQRDQNSSP